MSDTLLRWLVLNISSTGILIFLHNIFENEWMNFSIGLLIASWVFFIFNLIKTIKLFGKKRGGVV